MSHKVTIKEPKIDKTKSKKEKGEKEAEMSLAEMERAHTLSHLSFLQSELSMSKKIFKKPDPDKPDQQGVFAYNAMDLKKAMKPG